MILLSRRHVVLIDQLRAAEELLMAHGNTTVPVEGKPETQLLDEGDIKPLVDGYKILNVKFEDAFGRSWTPSSYFKRWAEVNQPGLVR